MNIVLISVAEGQFPVVYIVMSAAAPGFGRLSRAHTLADRRQWVPWHPCWLKKTAIPATCTVPGAVPALWRGDFRDWGWALSGK